MERTSNGKDLIQVFDDQEIRELEAVAEEGIRLLKIGMRAIRDASGEDEAKDMVLEKLKSDALALSAIILRVQLAQQAMRLLYEEQAGFSLDEDTDFRRDVLADLDDLPTTDDR